MRVSRLKSVIYSTRKKLLIVLSLTGKKGQLKALGKTGGFRFLVEGADSFPISSVSIVDSKVYIYTTAVYNAVTGLEYCALSYQPSENECIRDSGGSLLEPFECMPLEPMGNYSPYFHCGRMTAIMPLTKPWSELERCDIPHESAFHPFICNANVISPRILNHQREYPQKSVVFMRFALDCAEDMEVELLWGCSGKLKCWADNERVVEHSASELTFASLRQRVSLTAGRHTVTAAFCNKLAGRGDKGVSLKLLRLDSPNGELPMLVRSSDAELFLNA